MGACSFTHLVKGETAQSAHKEVAEKEAYDRGHSPYSGTIASTSLIGRIFKKYDKPNKKNRDEAFELAEERLGNIGKWECEAIELGVVEYWILTAHMKKNFSKQSPKYEIRFVITPAFTTHPNSSNIIYAKTKKEAETKAFSLVLKNNTPYDIIKEKILVSGQEDSYQASVKRKTFKTKPTRKLKPNERLVVIKEFLLYGWAGH